MNINDINTYIQSIRKGKTLVTTNGCFDIIHAGHIDFFKKCKQLGDILIVGINCDDRVRALKGEDRPRIKQGDRLDIVSAIRYVDIAFIFYEDDPAHVLGIIKPDIHCKGGDYTKDIPETKIVEANGGRIELIEFSVQTSSSKIIGG